MIDNLIYPAHFIELVFTEDWEEWTLETFFGEADNDIWSSAVVDQDTLESAMDYDFEGWHQDDINTEVEFIANEFVKEYKNYGMEVYKDGTASNDIFILGLKRKFIPIAKALLLWK